MNKLELIKINKENNTVSARELHEFLGVNTQFTIWFNRMCEYGFIDGTDYRAIIQKRLTAQNNTTTFLNYEITLDMAKEISMLQRTDKGKQARQYFINCEKKLKEVARKPLTTLEQLKLHYLAIDEQNKEISEVKAEVKDLKDSMPLFNSECKDIQDMVKSKGCEVLGGYHSNAYNNNSIRGKVYADIQRQLKREFGVRRYECIKHVYVDKAKQLVRNYMPPIFLVDLIVAENNQMRMF